MVFSDLPGDEEWIVLVTEGGDLRGLEVVEVAVQNVEAEVAHLRLDDPEAPPLRGHHGPRVIPVLLLPSFLIPATPSHPWDQRQLRSTLSLYHPRMPTKVPSRHS